MLRDLGHPHDRTGSDPHGFVTVESASQPRAGTYPGGMGNIGDERERIEVLPLQEPAEQPHPQQPAKPAEPARQPAPAK